MKSAPTMKAKLSTDIDIVQQNTMLRYTWMKAKHKNCVLLIPASMQAHLCEFQVSLVYTGSSRLARNTE